MAVSLFRPTRNFVSFHFNQITEKVPSNKQKDMPIFHLSHVAAGVRADL